MYSLKNTNRSIAKQSKLAVVLSSSMGYSIQSAQSPTSLRYAKQSLDYITLKSKKRGKNKCDVLKTKQ